ncbi:MAG: alpha/beta hydrolase [Bacteroidaceae bacterium]|nr:alpha/beta hydrolase [Bacteroidaceae bacterium]
MKLSLMIIMATHLLAACANDEVQQVTVSMSEEQASFTRSSRISDVMNDPAFGSYGRLLFPVNTNYWSGNTLEQLRLTWYTHINPDKTVEVVNTLKEHAQQGETVFLNIYTETEKTADPSKRDTGLFFFKGRKGAPFAICNAGGGGVFVGAMHDSFPHALEISKQGYNAFALIYRAGNGAMEDLARAIDYIFAHAEELEVDTSCYSLWGGSAGARMAASMGSYGPTRFGGSTRQKAGAVIMQYTGYIDASASDAPTYANVGDNDGIANWRTMQLRLERLAALGIPTEFHVYPGLPHGYGLGIGTVAEGWIGDAIDFWRKQM